MEYSIGGKKAQMYFPFTSAFLHLQIGQMSFSSAPDRIIIIEKEDFTNFLVQNGLFDAFPRAVVITVSSFSMHIDIITSTPDVRYSEHAHTQNRTLLCFFVQKRPCSICI